MLISALYFVLFIISIIATFIVADRIINRKLSYYTALFILITIVCLAYFAYSISTDTGMALVANQFSFLDGTFVMMFFLFCVMDICEIKVPDALSVPMIIINLAILISVFTVQYNHLLYLDYSFGSDYGASHLVTTLGPLYNLYVVCVIIDMLMPAGIIIYSAFHKKKISYKYTITLGLLLAGIVGLYFLEDFVDLAFDILPIGYVMMEMVILVILQRLELYDSSKLAVDTSEANLELGCVVFDPQLRFVGANSVAKYYFPELEELDIDRAVTSPFVLSEFVSWVAAFQTGEVTQKLYTRHDRKILCEIKPYYRTNKNKILGFLIEMRDDTAQQNLIEKLNTANDDLAEAVEAANNANASKSMFLASMSHEIRTPINAIIGMNEIARRECKQDDLLEYMDIIGNASNNLLALINDILDFSKIEAGKIDIVETEYQTGKLIRDILDITEFRANEKNLAFNISVSEDFPSALFGDENRIRQVIINVLNNAVKYTQEGSVSLSINEKKISDNSINMIATIKDTGIGMKKEDLANLYDSFSRFDEKENRNIEGTGLGMAITKRLVDVMNGSITVDSAYGIGTVFTITIPQQIKNNKPIGDYKIREVNQSLDDFTVCNASGKRILVVDDNLINLKVVVGLLKPTNADVTTARSGAECLKFLESNHFDIVFLDHMMPDMDGLETLDAAKTLLGDSSSDTVFIILTANAISGVREQYLEAGFDDYLSKPIKPQTLFESLSKYV